MTLPEPSDNGVDLEVLPEPMVVALWQRIAAVITASLGCLFLYATYGLFVGVRTYMSEYALTRPYVTGQLCLLLGYATAGVLFCAAAVNWWRGATVLAAGRMIFAAAAFPACFMLSRWATS